ncbi:D-glycero-alpha-D-manno-heptose-1,7-bisphosphate 7-phosphatase [Helicobacter turcicus]|uniref:D,D-heptose 1,7-bisphosphate phosphatase n=1 Tax=Helicobacter turcicus TaxID=2867412 RepID=A0ABS7JP17_9HELI|nr:HAD-IIIA family hydrolase [Helicobacter turcicus]MBX7491154.1 HAD-IIIA family hydrolase [Helicobacter turcicus]MBX7546021.1 HAD-IIIA family hydrolase [Helicobacter turcicus]
MNLTNIQKRKVVFFDRDGVVNLEDAPYGYKIDTFYFAPHFMELFLELKKQDALCFIVTNQSGIHRGIFTQKDFNILTSFMQSCIKSSLMIPLRESGFMPKNIGFDGVYFCPHTEEEHCSCRKPNSAMLEQAIKEFHLNIKDCDSYILGDKDTDMQAGLKVGIETRIFIGNTEAPNATHKVKNLKEAAKIIQRNDSLH